MTKTRRILALLLAVFCVILMNSCGKRVQGIVGMLEAARANIPSSAAKNGELNLCAIVTEDNRRLAWFKVGTEIGGYQYFPIEFERIEDTEYKFIRAYNVVISRCENTAILDWNDKYQFIIDNRECKTLRIIQTDGSTKNISVDKYPFTYGHTTTSIAEYYFLDEKGNEI